MEIDEALLPQENCPTQNTLESISNWTRENLMQLNEKKCNYMIFTRRETKFARRLNVNNIILDRVPVTVLLDVWLDEDLSFTRNCKEICIKAYSRVSMLTKLKYVGVSMEDLIDIYILYIRSVTKDFPP